MRESTSIDLEPKVFLVSRDESVKGLREWFVREPSQLAIVSRSPGEIIDFVCAAIAVMDDLDRDKVVARSVIIEDLRAWRSLRDASSEMTLIVDPSILLTAEDIGRAVTNGHHVLLAMDPQSTATASNTIELEHVAQHELTRALEDCGCKPVVAEQAARAAAGSLAILKRRLARFSTPYVLPFVDQIADRAIQTCLLIGGWDDGNNADRDAIQRLSGMSYPDFENHAQKLCSCRNPLLLHAAGKWRVISKDESWAGFGHLVSASALSAFETFAVEILAEDDPKFQLPGNERAFAKVTGQSPKHSTTIKQHVAETIALLGAIGDSLQASSSVSVVAPVERIVTHLLPPNATWHRWASLDRFLPLLAEGAPAPFLQAVKKELAKPQPEFVQLFREEGDGIFGGCNHCGLLWGLGCLAWSKEFVTDACMLLLGLRAIDPGGRTANRPGNSLCNILRPWFPQTTIDVLDRIKLLDLLIAKDSDTAWSVLFALLPEPMSTADLTRRPYWRDWAAGWSSGAMYEERRTFVLAVAGRVLQQSADKPSRWQQVIRCLGNFPYECMPS